MRRLGVRSRTARTSLGPVVFERQVFECPLTRQQVAPLDLELGLEPGAKMARDLVEKVAWAGARSSFAEASEDLRRLAGVSVSPAEVARVVAQEGGRVLELQLEREERWSEPVQCGKPVFPAEVRCARLVVEADATIALTVAGEEHKAVWCARAFDPDNCRGTDGSGRPHLTESRCAAGAGSLDQFGPRVGALANRMGARSARALAFIADGAAGLWNMAAERLSHAVMIQDFWHVSEHLHSLARDLLGGPGQAAREQAQSWCGLLRQSRVEEVIGQLRRMVEIETSKPKRERIEDELRYLEAGKRRMDYKRYESEGWPIGSGAIEGTCKHLAKRRLALTGARWRRANLPKIMALRQCQANAEWDQDFHPTLPAAA